MASTAIRLNLQTPKTLAKLRPFLRHSSSSSTTTHPLPPPSDSDPSTSSVESKPTAASHFCDIKAHLRQSPSATRQIPFDPPKPGFLSQSPSFPPSHAAASIEEVRKSLAEFRRRSAPPSTPSSSTSPRKPISLQDLYNEGKDGKPDLPSFDAIRDSLRQLSENTPSHKISDRLPSSRSSFLSLKNLRETKQSDFSKLPVSIFRKELEEAEKDEKGRSTDFLKMYTYEELGEKLRMLRPAILDSEKGEKKGSFTLFELNERLAKLRELEEKETNSRVGGHSFKDLMDTLAKLRDAENEDKKNASRIPFILPHVGGLLSQDIAYGPAKEHLVDKYFHPDLMSSEEKMKLELRRVREEFKMSESDCGSARVQVAQLTTKIKHLSSVLHKKDKHSQKGLQAMVQRRRKLLKYLRRTDWDSYCFVLSKLGLRDAPDYRV